MRRERPVMRPSAFVLGLACVTVVAAGSPSASRARGPDSSRDLRASTTPPWNPPAPVARSEPWERVMRAPGRLLSLPLVALGQASKSTLVYIEESHLIEKEMALFARQGPWGVAVLPSSLGERTGFGGELRWAPPQLRNRLLTQISGSTSGYNREVVTASQGPLSASYASEWRPRDSYFGLGLDAPHAGESTYGERLQSARLTLSRAWRGGETQAHSGSVRVAGEKRRPTARLQADMWVGPRVAFMTRGRDPGLPSFEVAHPGDAANSLGQRVEHLVYGARLARDSRWGQTHWAKGWRASLEGERYDRSIEALALEDAHTGARLFSRVSGQLDLATSFGVDPRTLRLSLKAVDQTLDDSGDRFLIADLMTLGGGAGLAGFEPGRFHDVDLALGKLTYIYPLGGNLEFDLHAESGGVYPRLGVASLRTLETSYGWALRLRTDVAMLGQVGMDFSREQARIRFSLGGAE